MLPSQTVILTYEYPQGYVCTSAIDTGLSSGYPRLVFSATKEDPDVEFFMIAFSNNRRKIKLINHPDPLGQSLSEILREEFPRRVISASWDDSDMYKIELNRWDSESALSIFLLVVKGFNQLYAMLLQARLDSSWLLFSSIVHQRVSSWSALSRSSTRGSLVCFKGRRNSGS